MAKQIAYPADTVDSSGKVWETIGENIRNDVTGLNQIHGAFDIPIFQRVA